MPAAPGSGAPPAIFDLTSTCTSSGSLISFTVNRGITGTLCTVTLTDDATNATVWANGFGGSTNARSFTISGTLDGAYTLTADNTEAQATAAVSVSCGAASTGMTLYQLVLAQPTLTQPTGGASIAVLGGTDPVTVTVAGVTTAPAPTTILANGASLYVVSGLAPGDYEALFTDAYTPARTLLVPFTINAAPVAVQGCQDEYAGNYDPAATDDTTPNSCTYAPRWRSAWQWMAVAVAAVAGQIEAYVQAELRIGFRPGHPLAGDRPYGDPLLLTATVGPSGYAVFRLGPYLRPALGALDEAGGRRLDLNSPSAFGADLYVGYELRRTTGELLEHGYALNSAVPDAVIGNPLTPFARLPLWPGFSDYLVALLGEANAGQFGLVENTQAYQLDTVDLPCPPNPLPVAWLAPGGGYGYFVFQGKPALSDVVGDGQRYREAETGESRWSERGESRRQYVASSGPFKGADLAEGLATLARSPQVWVQPVAGGPWVPVTLDAGTFPVATWGIVRKELRNITFTESASQWAQGQ